MSQRESGSSFSKEEHDSITDFLIQSARVDFVSFLHYMWPQVKGQQYVISKMHVKLAQLCQDAFDGVINPHQVVSVPPQHGKSRMLSVRCVAWLIGRKPGIHIALTGFSTSLLQDFISEARMIMQTQRYQSIFGEVIGVKGRNRAGDVLFSNGSNIQARSTGSKLTGRRVDWLVVDDPHSGRDDAESPTNRRRIHRWFYADCMSRVSSEAKIFIVSTRWHPEDLIGNLTSEEGRKNLEDAGFANWVFEQTNLKAIAEDIDDPLGREIGEALFPEQRPIEFLRGIKAIQPDYEWSSQYQGTPKAASGDQIDVTKVNSITIDEVPRDVEWVRGWDLAISENQQSNFTVGALCAMRTETKTVMEYDVVDKVVKEKVRKFEYFYVIDIKRDKKAWAGMRRMILDTSRADKLANGVTRIGIEAVAGFDAVYSDVRQELSGEVIVEKKNPPSGKLVRASKWLPIVDAGRFFIVRGAWNKDFLSELKVFPVGDYDDQVDAISICYEMLLKRDRLLIA